MSWSWKLTAAFVQVFWAYVGILIWGSDEAWMNGVLRGGVMLFCFTNAIFPFPDYFSVARLLRVSVLRSRSEVGYLVAGCAFFVALLIWWMLRKLGPPWAKTISTIPSPE